MQLPEHPTEGDWLRLARNLAERDPVESAAALKRLIRPDKPARKPWIVLDEERCIAEKADGSRCRGRALPNSNRCFVHDVSDAERKERQRRGGRAQMANLQRERRLKGRAARGSQKSDDKPQIPPGTRAALMEFISEGLNAKLAYLNNEPDYRRQALSLLILARYWRIDGLQEMSKLIRRMAPSSTLNRELHERRVREEFQKAKDELLAAIRSGEILSADLPPELAISLERDLRNLNLGKHDAYR